MVVIIATALIAVAIIKHVIKKIKQNFIRIFIFKIVVIIIATNSNFIEIVIMIESFFRKLAINFIRMEIIITTSSCVINLIFVVIINYFNRRRHRLLLLIVITYYFNCYHAFTMVIVFYYYDNFFDEAIY